MMKVLLLAAVVAMASAWQPGLAPKCNKVNTNGGSILMPHEKYCQLFYACDLEDNAKELYCPGQLLFAYGVGIAVCVPTNTGMTTYHCPNWPCNSQNDIGRKYPDTCCGKYWECTAVNVFTPKVCQTGTSFDSNSEICTVSQNSGCTNNKYCVDAIRPSNFNDCRDSAVSDPCKYKSQGWPFDRQCPVGTAFDTSTCSCSQFNQGCTASGISAAVLLSNKNPDPQCRASGRIDWRSNQLNVVSDKLGRNIDHYFFKSNGFTVQNNEGVFSTLGNQRPWIYDYYYNDNTLYAPLAIVMTVRFDFSNIQLNTQFSLLENRWTQDPSNTHCNPSTLSITARYLGIQIGDRRFEFTISAAGERVVSTGTASINGNANDYYKIVFTFGTRTGNTIGIGGSVRNMGQTGQLTNGNPVNFITDNRNMGSALVPNKCGFAIGRDLNGRIREFNVYEGCSSFNNLG